jgi:hypothetical protein
MTIPTVPRKTWAAGTLLLIALAACGQSQDTAPSPATGSAPPASAPLTTTAVPDREPHTLVLNATGGAKVTSIKYTLDGRVVQQGAVTLPWRESLTVPADGRPHSWTLEVEFTGTGRVELVAIVDGKVAAQGGSAGSGNTTGSAGVGGTVNG